MDKGTLSSLQMGLSACVSAIDPHPWRAGPAALFFQKPSILVGKCPLTTFNRWLSIGICKINWLIFKILSVVPVSEQVSETPVCACLCVCVRTCAPSRLCVHKWGERIRWLCDKKSPLWALPQGTTVHNPESGEESRPASIWHPASHPLVREDTCSQYKTSLSFS